MIPVNELMIGNWVALIDGRSLKIHGIEAPNGSLPDEARRVLTVNSLAPFRLEGLYPIPLTPELLERCLPLWKKDSNGEYYGNGAFSVLHSYAIDAGDANTVRVVLERAFWLHNYGNDVQIKYLHQLQNIHFVLTQKELTITL